MPPVRLVRSPMVTHALSPEVVADAHQLRELLVGVSALLQHPARTNAVDAAKGAALEARAVADRLVAHLDAHAAIQLEEERAERQQREGQNKITAGTVVGGSVR